MYQSIKKLRALFPKAILLAAVLILQKGREGNRQLTKSSFTVNTDDEGKEYLTMTYNELSKNHQRTGREEYQQSKRLYANGDDDGCPVNDGCPVKEYVSHLNP